jgi:hypothetical protein
MMKRFVCFFVFLLAASVLAQSAADIKNVANAYKSANLSSFESLQLPFIRGTWYYVDGDDGADTRSGKTPALAVKTISTAYGKCVTGRGDGIVLLSRTISGTSYSVTETARLTWAKYGITVFGVAAPNGYFGRARWTHTSAADSLASLMLLTGQNNMFYNINFYNSPDNDGDPVSATAVVSAVQLAGARNAFINCHFYCAPQSANAYKTDVELRASSDETTFDRCFFGSSSFDAGNNAACWVYYNGAAAQHFFRNCTFLQQVSAGTAFGGLESGGATYLNGIDIYEDCTFSVWRANTKGAICASLFIGTNFNTGEIGLRDCLTIGFTALDAVAGNDVIWTNQPAGNAAGGIGVAP